MVDVDEKIGTAMLAKLGLAASTNAMATLPMMLEAMNHMWTQVTHAVNVQAQYWEWFEEVCKANGGIVPKPVPVYVESYHVPWRLPEVLQGEEEEASGSSSGSESE